MVHTFKGARTLNPCWSVHGVQSYSLESFMPLHEGGGGGAYFRGDTCF